MGDRLKDRGAIVTGAGRGIGRAIALALAAEGAKVVVVDPGVSIGGEGFESAPADETVAEIKKRGGTAIANYGSVADFEVCRDIVKSCVGNFGSLDILVNNAASVRVGLIGELAEEDWDKVIKVDLYGTFNTMSWAVPVMKEQRRGRIINIIAGVFTGAPDDANTAAAKSGIVGLSGTAAIELANFGVTCNMVAPGAATRLTLGATTGKHHLDSWLEIGIINQKEYERRLALVGVPREGAPGPEHVAPMVVYLCTDEASNINGKIFQSGGGGVGVYGEPQSVVKQIFNNGEIWDLERLIELVPRALLTEHRSPWSSEPEKKSAR